MCIVSLNKVVTCVEVLLLPGPALWLTIRFAYRSNTLPSILHCWQSEQFSYMCVFESVVQYLSIGPISLKFCIAHVSAEFGILSHNFTSCAHVTWCYMTFVTVTFTAVGF